MKRKIFFAAMAAISLAACSRNTSSISETDSEEVQIRFSAPVLSTKTTGAVDDEKVNNLQIFIFDKVGRIETYGYVNDDELTLTCKTGVKDIVAIANTNTITGISTYADLLRCRADLADMGNSSLVMSGIRQDYEFLPTDESVTVNVTRLPAKIILSKVSVDFELEVYQNTPLEILSVFVVNAAGDRDILAAYKDQADIAPIGNWYNKMGYADNPLDLLKDDVSSVMVNENEPYTVQHTFFCYPNPTVEDSSSEDWSPRRTRLVVEAKLGNDTYFYPVTLPVMESNMQYNVQLTVTRPGSSGPDLPVTKQDAVFNVTVAPWSGTDDVFETI